MSECSHDCSSCGQKDCGSREIPKEQLNEFSRVKKVIGIVSGKGGVGKSLVTSMMASATNKRGFNTAVLDADITGPSIPRMFGIKEHALGDGKNHIFPCRSSNGVDIMSINLLLESDTDPVVWRGPVIAGVVKQFWTEVVWKDIDYMYVDMPPGTGDVPLTVFQSLPVDGIIVVTSPQSLVSMVVAKAVRMAELMNIPILGIVENMSYFTCPDCGREIKVFGDSHVEEIATTYGIPLLARLPIDPAAAAACDSGKVESIDTAPIQPALDKILSL
ncbi:MAG: Mrp/NBP35 family ATP-binding protein [Eubacteriales bacterium]|nr:Mrp/NBP35 family ATP-binding protein [Clostridiales bacterium]MDY5675284.1 Mrp/NBP35 family ATP-binding protein [Eubacteriales bacterium]MDY5802033.1 Mrp/NBP35 family ATP-binding protein [Eubacteriales bacterium]